MNSCDIHNFWANSNIHRELKKLISTVNLSSLILTHYKRSRKHRSSNNRRKTGLLQHPVQEKGENGSIPLSVSSYNRNQQSPVVWALLQGSSC